jgi:hypothetical protein
MSSIALRYGFGMILPHFVQLFLLVSSTLPAQYQLISSIQAAYCLLPCSVALQKKYSCSPVYVQCITGHILDKYWTYTGEVLDIYTACMLAICCLKGGNKQNKVLIFCFYNGSRLF